MAACGSGGGGGGGGGGGSDSGTAALDCNGATSSTADSVTVAVDAGTEVSLEEALPSSLCIDATYDVEEDTNTISIAATASQPGVTISLEALGPGEYTYGAGNGIGDLGLMYQATSASTVIYIAWNECTNDATVNLNAYSTRLTGDYTATLFGYNVNANAVDCDDTIAVSGTVDVARSEFTYPESLGDTECATVNEGEICFVVAGDTAVTYTSGVDGNAFSASYDTVDAITTIETAMTENVDDPDLSISFNAAGTGTYRFSTGKADVQQLIGFTPLGTPPFVSYDSLFISNDDEADDPANDCGVSTVQVTQYGSVGGRIVGRFVAELFEYDWDGSDPVGGPHTLWCDAAHRRVIYGMFNVERSANTNGS